MPKTAVSSQLEASSPTLKLVSMADIQEYLREMEEETIPAIVKIVRERAVLAEESRKNFICG